MIEVKTRNSTYHIDEVAQRVRRSEPNADASHRLADGEWRQYTEYRMVMDYRLMFFFGDGKATTTSTVVSQREIDAA